jgi:S1-C subfamily serine protease
MQRILSSRVLQKAIIIAASIIVTAVVIFFAYLLFDNNTGNHGLTVPYLGQIAQTGTTTITRNNNLGQEAFTVGKTSLPRTSNPDLTLPELFDTVEKSVVQITDSIQSNPQTPRLGSGFIYDENGHIVTNYHVVNGDQSNKNRLDVTFPDGTIYRATLIGSDAYTDLAVLYVANVPKDKLAPLPLGNSSGVRVGEEVAAIGNPFGLSGSMTEGIISGLGRLMPAQQAGDFSIPDVIQTDAPINPGNSGGPLLNTKAEVVGINSAIYSTTGEFAGVGFAIPSDTISKVVPSLITSGVFRHPWLGVSGVDMTPGIADTLGLKEPRGFLVVDVVNGSPADKAGIKSGDRQATIDGRPIKLDGDVITKVDGKMVRKIDDILTYLQREKTVGDNIQLTILRNGKEQQLTILLAARPSQIVGSP